MFGSELFGVAELDVFRRHNAWPFGPVVQAASMKNGVAPAAAEHAAHGRVPVDVSPSTVQELGSR